MRAVLWDATTGRIVQRITGSEAAIAAAAASAGLAVLPAPDASVIYEDTHHVVDGQLVEDDG